MIDTLKSLMSLSFTFYILVFLQASDKTNSEDQTCANLTNLKMILISPLLKDKKMAVVSGEHYFL
jgi:hypothetical protein